MLVLPVSLYEGDQGHRGSYAFVMVTSLLMDDNEKSTDPCDQGQCDCKFYGYTK